MTNKVFIYSNGCIENLVDDSLFREFFSENNWQIVDNYSNADLILVNTCANGPSSEDDSIEKIVQFQKKKTSQKLIVCGCLPKMNEERLREVFKGTTFGPRELNRLDELIKAKIKIAEVKGNILDRKYFVHYSTFMERTLMGITQYVAWLEEHFNINLKPYFRRLIAFWYDTNMFYIKVATGCLNNCSYCAIKHAKGSVKSKPTSEIIREFRYGLKQGYKEFVLSADDVGSYGRDIDTNLIRLLEEILKEKGDYKIHIRYIAPERLIEMFLDLKEVFRTNKILSFCSSAQSGNNRILKLMNKKFTIEEWRKCIRELNKEFPSLLIRTQVIVGFPSETEEEFNDTLKLVDKLKFDSVAVFKYFNAPNTEASNMGDPIPESIKKKRKKKLLRRWFLNKMKDHVKFKANAMRN